MHNGCRGAWASELGVFAEYIAPAILRQDALLDQASSWRDSIRVLLGRGALLEDCVGSLQYNEPCRSKAASRLESLYLAGQNLADRLPYGSRADRNYRISSEYGEELVNLFEEDLHVFPIRFW
jgi:hypothetical protein